MEGFARTAGRARHLSRARLWPRAKTPPLGGVGPFRYLRAGRRPGRRPGQAGSPGTSVCPGRIRRSAPAPAPALAPLHRSGLELLPPGAHVMRLARDVNGPRQAVVHPRAAQAVGLAPGKSTLPSHDGGTRADSPGSDAARVIHSLPNLIGAGLDGREHSDPIVVQDADVKPYSSPGGLPAKSTRHPGHRTAITTVNEHRGKQGGVQCGSNDLGCGDRSTSGVEQDVAPEKVEPGKGGDQRTGGAR